MPPSALAALAALVAASFWLLSRRRPLQAVATDRRILDGQAIAALNRAQIALAAPSGPPPAPAPAPLLPPLPLNARERAMVLRRLKAQLAGGAPERLAAIEAAGLWGSRACLPLLQRGLRDVDPAVVGAAAAAMERFRGRSAGAWSGGSAPAGVQAPLPRNVARTR